MANPAVALWRTIEAELGYDVDDVPVEVINRLNEWIAELVLEAVSEACLSKQGNDVTRALEDGLPAVENTGTKVDLSAAVSAARLHPDEDLEETPLLRTSLESRSTPGRRPSRITTTSAARRSSDTTTPLP
ncbi:MAG: hypothetical protein OXN97_10680 [Bryobacterales bacterium]|nr:hypothetical protein [Bryobacterales bacterium]